MRLRHCLIALVMGAGLSIPAHAQEAGGPAIVNVNAFRLNGGMAANQKALDAIKSQLNLARSILTNDSCTARLMVGSFAGEGAGVYVVTVACPNMETFLSNGRKLQANAQWTKAMAEQEAKFEAAKGTVLSSSIYQDVP